MNIEKTIPAALLACVVSAFSACSATPEDGWRPLFDGRTLDGWQQAGFLGEGQARVEDETLLLPAGDMLTGLKCQRELPASGYEISLEARRVSGGDFFCGVTFPVHDSSASLILGGWGGGVCGLSCINGRDASENETTSYRQFEAGRWYRVRLKVAGGAIEAWLDDEEIVSVDTEGKRIATRPDIDLCRPFGLATWRTSGALRNVRWRPVGEPAGGK